MTARFFALLTNIGAAKLANATALGTSLEITHMVVGDGGGTLPTPNPAQTKLVNEQRRAALNMLTIDPINTSQIIAEQIIPETEGGWWIREIGLLDKDGDLVAIANCAETYKPQLQEGSGRTQTIRMILIVSSTAAVTLKIDPSVVLATRKYVDDNAIEVKAYADDLLDKHAKASDPHKQYLKIASNLAEIKAAGAAAVVSALSNIGALPVGGTAAAATKLATKRKIGGVDFDGTADISLPFINATDTSIQLEGILGSKGLQVFPLPDSPEGGEINLYDKDNKQAAYIDIDSSGNFRVVTDGLGTSVLISRASGDVFIQKSLTATGVLKSAGIISEGTVYAGNTAAWLATDGNVYGPIWGGFLSTYLSNRGVRAWAAVQGNGTIISSFGFAAINRTNVGGYNFTMSTSNGAYAVTVGINGGSQNVPNIHSANIWNRTPNSFSIQNARDGGTSYD
ncbi:phage tail protein [Yersinia intermedia]|uniref:phage tail-collar fiber domain-containing protein n=1 Tax=Yersinia intermedia TaxID=631 RepID=UPI002244D7A8|nr:phage tail protein [Yersinia intermedia]MCW8111903.1 phage tail protein [Yersinia intermedia]MDA5516903.1 phage tail protein [Yersinia intermedia]